MARTRTADCVCLRIGLMIVLSALAQPGHALPEDCIADGGQAACTAPSSVPTPWIFYLCDDVGPYPIRSHMWCLARGGTLGTNGACTDPDPTLDEPELYPYSEKFERLIHNVQNCQFQGQDRGWLSPGQIVNSYQCWSGGPIYQDGIEVFNLREMLFSGQTYNTLTQSCGGAWNERVLALRTRQLETGCPAGHTLRRSRFTGRLECFRKEACPVEPSALETRRWIVESAGAGLSAPPSTGTRSGFTRPTSAWPGLVFTSAS